MRDPFQARWQPSTEEQPVVEQAAREPSTMVQLKVTLSKELHMQLKKRAEMFGMTLASYIKTLIVADIKQTMMPTQTPSRPDENLQQFAYTEEAAPAAESAEPEELPDFLR